jgi:hypothetical protein
MKEWRKQKKYAVMIAIMAGVTLCVSVIVVRAATNISTSAGEYWGWNDIVGWIRFNTPSGAMSVNVTNSKITGYATSTAGDISFDCATTSIGDICGQSNYGVTNDGLGNISGYAWNDIYGWISFDCHNTGGCASSTYQTTIDGSGYFQNYAWNDIIGWISFNCANTGTCGTSDYKVKTTWNPTSTIALLDSTIFDTQQTTGAQIHSIIWHGEEPTATSVRFQIATSNNASSSWVFMGPDGTSNSWYPQDTTLTAGDSIPVDYTVHNNARYIRYRIQLASNPASSTSPRVDDVIINWSP